jgi:hypothetical protein
MGYQERILLLGHAPGNVNGTEYVFPKWLQLEFGLTKKRIQLLNRTTIPYRKLTVQRKEGEGHALAFLSCLASQAVVYLSLLLA